MTPRTFSVWLRDGPHVIEYDHELHRWRFLVEVTPLTAKEFDDISNQIEEFLAFCMDSNL